MRVFYGFTLVELMTVLAVVAVLSVAGAPAMDGLLKDLRLKSQTQAMVQTMHWARGEAVKRRLPVLLCRSGNPEASTPSCGGAARNWSTGWLVFASGDGNDTYDPADDTLLRVATAAPIAVTVRSNTTADEVLGFDPDGTTYGGIATARFAVCDERGDTEGRQVNVPPYGRPRTVEATLGTPIDCDTPA